MIHPPDKFRNIHGQMAKFDSTITPIKLKLYSSGENKFSTSTLEPLNINSFIFVVYLTDQRKMFVIIHITKKKDSAFPFIHQRNK